MADLSTIPQEVNIVHYGGDTLTLHINIAPELIGGREFRAEVRSKATLQRVDATFVVVLTAAGADIQLLSADCQRLSARGTYEGVWDVQLAMPDGGDPVTTLGYGELSIVPDVTKPRP